MYYVYGKQLTTSSYVALPLFTLLSFKEAIERHVFVKIKQQEKLPMWPGPYSV